MGKLYFEEKSKALVVQEAQVLHMPIVRSEPIVIEKQLPPEIVIQKEYIENKFVMPNDVVYIKDIIPLEEQIEELFVYIKEYREILTEYEKQNKISYSSNNEHILILKDLVDNVLEKLNAPPPQKHWTEKHLFKLAIGGAIVASILINLLF